VRCVPQSTAITVAETILWNAEFAAADAARRGKVDRILSRMVLAPPTVSVAGTDSLAPRRKSTEGNLDYASTEKN